MPAKYTHFIDRSCAVAVLHTYCRSSICSTISGTIAASIHSDYHVLIVLWKWCCKDTQPKKKKEKKNNKPGERERARDEKTKRKIFA